MGWDWMSCEGWLVNYSQLTGLPVYEHLTEDLVACGGINIYVNVNFFILWNVPNNIYSSVVCYLLLLLISLILFCLYGDWEENEYLFFCVSGKYNNQLHHRGSAHALKSDGY